MSDRVLPTFLVFLEKRKLLGDVRVNLAEGGAFRRAVLYSHGDQSNVGVRWLGQSLCGRRGRLRLRLRAAGTSRRCRLGPVDFSATGKINLKNSNC